MPQEITGAKLCEELGNHLLSIGEERGVEWYREHAKRRGSELSEKDKKWYDILYPIFYKIREAVILAGCDAAGETRPEEIRLRIAFGCAGPLNQEENKRLFETLPLAEEHVTAIRSQIQGLTGIDTTEQ